MGEVRGETMFAKEDRGLAASFVDDVQGGDKIEAVDETCSLEFVNHRAPSRCPRIAKGYCK
jgi:hypothetical protein